MIGLYEMKTSITISRSTLKSRLAERPERYPWSAACGQFLLDPSRFDQLQGLKPNESITCAVAAKAATHKS